MSHNIDGIIPINKPAGMTSHDVVARLRKILGIKKIGHAGTLDPDVTGVLIICIGKGTRLSEYLMEMPKSYKCELTLGISTNTQDFSGDIIDKKPVNNLDKKMIETVIKSFVGSIEQIPPMYSSVKINGKKLYTLAREGKEIRRDSRKITIYNIDIENIDLNKSYPTVSYTVKCSKGTYIRTLCVDIGDKLGYPAHMSRLERIESGAIKVEDSYTLEEIEYYRSNNRIQEITIPMVDSLPGFYEHTLSNEDITSKIYNGQKIYLNQIDNYNGLIKVLSVERKLIALYKKEENSNYAKPIKVFK